MRRRGLTLPLLALPLLVLGAASLAFLGGGKAQSSCCFNSRCTVFQDNGPEDKLCVDLGCSGSSTACTPVASAIACERLPAGCAPGSEIDVRMHCSLDQKTASYSHNCLDSEGNVTSRTTVIRGPEGCCRSTPTPTPTPRPTPEQNPLCNHVEREECRRNLGFFDEDICKCFQLAANPFPTPCPEDNAILCCGCFAPADGCQYEENLQCNSSPVLIDVAGDGFSLSDAGGGVHFDLDGDGHGELLSWTKAGSDDAWLVLDRDSDGTIGNGQELFGNFTPQPAPPPGEGKNGFLALAEFDSPAQGGNGDWVIDGGDAIYSSLRLWQDRNHNGTSEPDELHALASLDVARIHLDYRESRRVDEHNNKFKYRAKVRDAKGARVGRWAWDVFLVSGQ